MWDVFICHAWEDKEEIARPLAEALQQAGLRVWYDEFTLELGDSLRRSINQGLKASRYGVVILSPAFFKKEWPQKELDGLAAKERHGEKVILPVWHNATYDDVEQYSPELADRLAVSTERGLTGVVRQILRVCRKHKARQEPPKPPGKQEVPHVRQKPQSPPSTQVEAQEPERETKPKPRSQKSPETAVIHLRSESLTVSKEEFREVFGLDKNQRPLEYIKNDFEIQGEVIEAHATGLMWQKAGSENYMTYGEAQEYVKKLNQEQFAGYDDWRLPSIPELMSLLEPEKQSNGLYMSPVFDKKQRYCWSADRLPESEGGSFGAVWHVYFGVGDVSWLLIRGDGYVRCVRSRQQEAPHARQESEKETTPKPPPQKSPEASVIHLRSEPLKVSEDEAQKVFGLQTQKLSWGTVWRPLEYIQNGYEDQGEIVIDHATGLMWQKSGSDKRLTYEEAEKYVQELNYQRVAGYNDWRLPTIPELMVLLEPKEQSNGLYINPVFDTTHRWCWSVDHSSSESAWFVSFLDGGVGWDAPSSDGYVRCVRSRQQEAPHARQEPKRETKIKPRSQKSPETAVIHLRSESLTVSKEEFREVFGLDKGQRPLEYIQNDYEDRGEVVVDRATGLVWQKAGSAKRLTYKKAKEYVKELNRQKFAGHEDWRLPMIPELMSLLESEKESNDLYINPVFDSKQWWCWSADRLPTGERSLSESAWSVDFYNGLVYWRSLTSSDHVRCVRSIK